MFQRATINVEYYSSAGAIERHFEGKERWPWEGHQRVLVLHDNAPAHRALATQKNLGFCCLITHPILQIWRFLTTTCSLE